MKIQGIYAIRHTESGRVYVGSAVDLNTRWSIHRHHLNAGKHHSVHLQAVWTKDGSSAFTISLIEAVPNKADLLAREQHWIDALNAMFLPTGFNCCPVAGSPLGTKHSEATKAKMRAAKLGKPAPWNSKPRTAEEKLNLSLKMKGRKIGPHSPEHCAKISASHMGNQYGLGNKGARGRTMSAEQKEIRRIAMLGNTRGAGKQSDETKARKSIAAKARWARVKQEHSALHHSSQPDQVAALPARPLRALPLSASQASLSFD